MNKQLPPSLTLTALAVSCAVLTGCGSSGGGGNVAKMVTTPMVSANQNSTDNTSGNAGSTGSTNTTQTSPDIFKVTNGALRANVEKELKEDYPDVVMSTYSVTIDGKSYANGDNIDFQAWNKGFHTLPVVETATGSIGGDQGEAERRSTLYLFKQDYSMIAGVHTTHQAFKDMHGGIVDSESVDELNFIVKGEATKNLPMQGEFAYKGKAKLTDGDGDGDVNYTVNFAEKVGSGKITSDRGVIELSEAKIVSGVYKNQIDNSTLVGHGIGGAATRNGVSGEYNLAFFGPNAEEIIGDVEVGNTVGIFGATKQ